MTASETPGVDRSLRIRQAITITVIAGLCFIAWRNQVAKNQAEQVAQAEAVPAKEALKNKRADPSDEQPAKPTRQADAETKLPAETSTEPSEPERPAKAAPAKDSPSKSSDAKSAATNSTSAKSNEVKVKPAPSQTKETEQAKIAAKPKQAPLPEKKGPAEKPKIRTKIDNQTIRNEDGEVVFRGTVDLSNTIERVLDERVIERFRHDGITFQNRERKLPQKAPGYYREWVHPTEGLGGPGPQRIISGDGGELYYTPNHYVSFIKLN